jgi:hypothetical protein
MVGCHTYYLGSEVWFAIVNVHAQMKDRNNDVKNSFYEEL